MTKQQLEEFATQIHEDEVNIWVQTKAGKWYEKQYSSVFTEIKTDTVYGISFGDSEICYDFKAGKNIDNIMKSFVNQYISKYASKQMRWDSENSGFTKVTKEQALNKLKNQDRVTKSFFYTTLYGIGCISFIVSATAFKTINKLMHDYLTKNNISYTNEYSEAGWVYRFVINKSIEEHNEILKNLEL